MTGIVGCARSRSGAAADAAAAPGESEQPAPPHSITSSASASSVGGISRPSAFAVFRLMNKLEFGGLHHRQVGWFFAPEHAAGIEAGLAKRVGNAGVVAGEAAASDRLARGIHCGNAVTRRKRDGLLPVVEHERAAANHRAHAACCHRRESGLDIAGAGHIEHDEVLSHRLRGGLNVSGSRSPFPACAD